MPERPDYKIVRSDRRTVSIVVGRDGEVVVRAPFSASDRELEALIEKHASWIEKKKKALSGYAFGCKGEKLTSAQLEDIRERAREYIPPRVEYYASRMGLKYNKVNIKLLRSKWGSCSTKRNLNFNALLMLTDPECIDSVVVHELAHLAHMDHSRAFYAVVYEHFPLYDAAHKRLRQLGKDIFSRAF